VAKIRNANYIRFTITKKKEVHYLVIEAFSVVHSNSTITFSYDAKVYNTEFNEVCSQTHSKLYRYDQAIGKYK
jgi:hypothetical protein